MENTSGSQVLPSVTAVSVDDCPNQFKPKALRVLEAIVPVMTKMTSGEQKAPWRNTRAVAKLIQTFSKTL